MSTLQDIDMLALARDSAATARSIRAESRLLLDASRRTRAAAAKLRRTAKEEQLLRAERQPGLLVRRFGPRDHPTAHT
jgi:hypothetical protein